MTTEIIYEEVLNALESLDKTEVSEYWKKYLQREYRTGAELRNSAVFRGDTATILYALKLDLEEQLRLEQARKNGRKNYSAVKRFMKMCRESAETKPFFSFAHEFDGRFFACNSYSFYVSDSRDGLVFAPPQQEKIFEPEVKRIYQNTIMKFDTYGQTYEIPYTVSQLRAWKKVTGQAEKTVLNRLFSADLRQRTEIRRRGRGLPDSCYGNNRFKHFTNRQQVQTRNGKRKQRPFRHDVRLRHVPRISSNIAKFVSSEKVRENF